MFGSPKFTSLELHKFFSTVIARALDTACESWKETTVTRRKKAQVSPPSGAKADSCDGRRVESLEARGSLACLPPPQRGV